MLHECCPIHKIVTLRQGLKPHGFFCLSSVRDRLSNAAWLRLGASRSGGGKARNQRIHSCLCFLGGARPVSLLMPHAKGRMAHNLRLASWRRPTPASFNAAPLGTYPRGGGFSLLLFFTNVTLPKAVEWLPVPSRVERAYTSGNAVTFLRMALRHATHTLFSCSRYYESILLRWVKSGNARAKAHTRLTAWVLHRSSLRRAKARFCQQNYSLQHWEIAVSKYEGQQHKCSRIDIETFYLTSSLRRSQSCKEAIQNLRLVH